jgi:RNase H-like domain found in reverse transcriptase
VGNTKLQWSAAMAAAFAAVKEAVAAACELQHPAPGAKLAMVTDASSSHIGAVLQQRTTAGGGWKLLAFYSASCSPFISPSVTLGLCWRAAASPFLRITGRCWAASVGCRTLGPPASYHL